MKVGIIDDEIHNRRVIRSILTEYSKDTEIVAEEGSVHGAAKVINESRPDVIFLDIQLKGGTGFDVLNLLNYSPEIIFTTAYSEYAINAFRVRAVDYLLKPINEEELLRALQQCREKIHLHQSVRKQGTENPLFFHVSTIEGRQSLRLDEILYFESSGSYTYCVTNSRRILFSRNLGEVEKELKSPDFFRIHHSFVVNVAKIKRVEFKRNGQVYLVNNDSIPVAQRKTKAFREVLESFKVQHPGVLVV